MRDYLRDARVHPTALQKNPICMDIITEETDKYFKENANVDTVLADIERRTNEELITLGY
jgi:hypothetical protein